MAEDITLKLSLAGNITLPLFSEAIRGLSELVAAVDQEFGVTDATWIVEELHVGNATAMLRGTSAQQEALANAVIAIVRTTDLVARGLDEAVPETAAKSARRLTSVVNGAIPSLSLQAGDDIVTVTSGPARIEEPHRQVSSQGRLVGIVQTFPQAHGLHFRMIDEASGHSVAGKVSADLSATMRKFWGKRAIVEGVVTRDARTGLPLTIMDVRSVEPVPIVPPGAFQRARGILEFSPENEPAEVVIRRLRDAG